MELAECAANTLRCMNDAVFALGPAVARLSSALEHFGTQVYYAVAWDAYIKAGAPYGETREGLMRWINQAKNIGNESADRKTGQG